MHYFYGMEKEGTVAIPGTQSERVIRHIVLTGNKVIDCIQAAIKFHQDNFIPLRTISLIPSWYEKFFAYMDKSNYRRTGEHLREDTILCLFDVDIKKGSRLQKTEMYFEHYFTSRNEDASSYFGPEAKA
jgi:hypothetical protein